MNNDGHDFVTDFKESYKNEWNKFFATTRKLGIRKSDIIRTAIILVIVAIVIFPKADAAIRAARHRAWMEEFDARFEYAKTKKKQWDEERGWDRMSPDEKFASFVKERDSQVIDVEINEVENIIYIYIESNNGNSKEVWDVRKEYHSVMADIASGSQVEKEVWLVGIENGICVWGINGAGNIANEFMEGGDEIEL